MIIFQDISSLFWIHVPFSC